MIRFLIKEFLNVLNTDPILLAKIGIYATTFFTFLNILKLDIVVSILVIIIFLFLIQKINTLELRERELIEISNVLILEIKYIRKKLTVYEERLGEFGNNLELTRAMLDRHTFDLEKNQAALTKNKIQLEKTNLQLEKITSRLERELIPPLDPPTDETSVT